MPTQTPTARLSAQDLAEYTTLYARRNALLDELGTTSTSISAGGNTQSLQRDAATISAELRAVTDRMRELLHLPNARGRRVDLPSFAP